MEFDVPRHQVIMPDGQTFRWKIGEEVEIRWLGYKGAEVSIFLYKDSKYQRTITKSTTNDGAYDWTIPEDLETGANYQFKIMSEADSAQYSFSKTPFTVQPADLAHE